MQILVRTSDRLVLQFGTSLPPAGAGQALENLTESERAALSAAYSAGANAGVTISADHQTITALPYVAPTFTNPFDSPKSAMDAFATAVANDTTALGSGRSGVNALNPPSVTSIATAVTYLTNEKTALLAEIDALHQTLADVRTALQTLAGVVVTLRANLPATTP